MPNLRNLIKHCFPEYTQPDMEHIAAYIRPPWWKLVAITQISPASKDEAQRLINNDSTRYQHKI